VLGNVLEAGSGAFDVHLFINARGMTQIVSLERAAELNLLSSGYEDRGALFASADFVDDGGAAPADLVGVPTGLPLP
jgi:hypothetical protein